MGNFTIFFSKAADSSIAHALLAEFCLLLGLCKETVKESKTLSVPHSPAGAAFPEVQHQCRPLGYQNVIAHMIVTPIMSEAFACYHRNKVIAKWVFVLCTTRNVALDVGVLVRNIMGNMMTINEMILLADFGNGIINHIIKLINDRMESVLALL